MNQYIVKVRKLTPTVEYIYVEADSEEQAVKATVYLKSEQPNVEGHVIDSIVAVPLTAESVEGISFSDKLRYNPAPPYSVLDFTASTAPKK
jgi:hypothetical protein